MADNPFLVVRVSGDWGSGRESPAPFYVYFRAARSALSAYKLKRRCTQTTRKVIKRCANYGRNSSVFC